MKPNIGLNLRVTGHCNQGGRKYMEDAFVVAYQQSENLKELVYAYFGIFDGHGGKEAALFAKEHLMNNIVSQKGFWSKDDDQVLKAIREGFLATHDAMWREVDTWPKTASGLPSTSGTTSSIAFIRKQKLYIGHVGDSKIVLGYQPNDSDCWRAKSLTTDHKPESVPEKMRIHTAGGLVMKKAGVQRVVWNRPNPGHKGPIRRSTPVDQIPFLAVSRSLGDLWSFNYSTKEFVVSPEPDVEVIELNPRTHRCIIFGSDGLWNMLSPQSAVGIVQRTDEENEKVILEGGKEDTEKQLNNPSRLLVDTALNCWFNLRMRADNISVVTVMLDPPGPCKREVLLRQRVMQRLRPRDEQSLSEDETAPKDTSPSSSMKDRKRPIECLESPKERKLVEPPSKERKLLRQISDEPAVPLNLPRPVILSPIKVKSRHDSSNVKPGSSNAKPGTSNSNPGPSVANPASKPPEDTTKPESCGSPLLTAKPPDTSPSSTTDAKMVKKGHDPPINNEVPAPKNTETENQFTTPSEQCKSGSSEKVGECSSKSSDSCENNASDKLNSPLAGGRSSDMVPKTDSSSSSKENGRVHLCEVDNFLKLNRTSDCSSEPRKVKSSKVLEKTDSVVVASKVKYFRKSTILHRNSTIRKKYITTLRKPRLPKNLSPCRTRAQSNIQKLKV